MLFSSPPWDSVTYWALDLETGGFDAKKDAIFELGKDLRFTTYKTGLDAAKTNIGEIQKQVQEIAKTNPWLERQLLGVADKLGKTKTNEDFIRMMREGS